eukprot:249332-Pleurochrysis_carterae.AAC.1
MFPLWDAIPSEFIIKHPRLVWDRLYVRRLTYTLPLTPLDLYYSKMEVYSTSKPLLSKSVHAPGS